MSRLNEAEDFDYDPDRVLWVPSRRSFVFLLSAAIVAPMIPAALNRLDSGIIEAPWNIASGPGLKSKEMWFPTDEEVSFLMGPGRLRADVARHFGLKVTNKEWSSEAAWDGDPRWIQSDLTNEESSARTLPARFVKIHEVRQ